MLSWNLLSRRIVEYCLDGLYNSLLFEKKIVQWYNILLCNLAIRIETELYVAIIFNKSLFLFS